MAQMLSSLSMRTRVRERPGVEALADLADELAVRTELEQLRRGRRIGRAVGAVRAREDEDVALGIDGDAGHLAEIHARGKLEEIRTESKAICGTVGCASWFYDQQQECDPDSSTARRLPQFTLRCARRLVNATCTGSA